MEGIINLHHDIMFFLIWVIVLVSFLMFNFIIGKSSFLDIINIFEQISTNNLQIEKINSEKLVIELPTEIQHNTFLEIV